MKNWSLTKYDKRSLCIIFYYLLSRKRIRLEKKFLYWRILGKNDEIYWPIVTYQIHSFCNFFFARRYLSQKYFILLDFLDEENTDTFKMLRYRSFSKKELYHKKMFSYFYFYNFLFSNMRNALASLVKKKKKRTTAHFTT